MNITITQEESVFIASLDGRLDTVAAQQAAQDIEKLLQHADSHIILDCEKMPYISSSGLRLFLSLRKEAAAKNGKVSIKNINPDVRQVFKMTGFDTLFEIID